MSSFNEILIPIWNGLIVFELDFSIMLWILFSSDRESMLIRNLFFIASFNSSWVLAGPLKINCFFWVSWISFRDVTSKCEPMVERSFSS